MNSQINHVGNQQHRVNSSAVWNWKTKIKKTTTMLYKATIYICGSGVHFSAIKMILHHNWKNIDMLCLSWKKSYKYYACAIFPLWIKLYIYIHIYSYTCKYILTYADLTLTLLYLSFRLSYIYGFVIVNLNKFKYGK